MGSRVLVPFRRGNGEEDYRRQMAATLSRKSWLARMGWRGVKDRQVLRCHCAAVLHIEDGLVLCANEHVIALASALPAGVVEKLDEVVSG